MQLHGPGQSGTPSQLQTPLKHWPNSHNLPHAPQLVGSERSETHLPLHVFLPAPLHFFFFFRFPA